MKHFYIVPAWSDQAGQCRIVSRETDFSIDVYKSYNESPQIWKEAGLMNSQGKLVCIDATPEQAEDIKSCEPLMAGTSYSY
jgi:hypothetical protein